MNEMSGRRQMERRRRGEIVEEDKGRKRGREGENRTEEEKSIV